MNAIGSYDADLQQFVEEAHALDQAHLGFMRWLVEHEKLDDDIGPIYVLGPAIWNGLKDEER